MHDAFHNFSAYLLIARNVVFDIIWRELGISMIGKPIRQTFRIQRFKDCVVQHD